MKKIFILYHSQTGHTEAMADAVREGVDSIDGAQACARRAGQATLDDLLFSDGLIIGSPEYFGYMAGAIKDFFDRTYEPARQSQRIFRKPYAVFIAAGNDGTGALASIERICRGYQLKKVFEPIVIKGDITDRVLARCRELGQTIAAGCVNEIY